MPGHPGKVLQSVRRNVGMIKPVFDVVLTAQPRCGKMPRYGCPGCLRNMDENNQIGVTLFSEQP